jgi:hypothetical protein
MVPRLMRDVYKRRRAEADTNEVAIRHRMATIVDDLEGLGEPEINLVDIADQRVEEMIGDLHRERDQQSTS